MGRPTTEVKRRQVTAPTQESIRAAIASHDASARSLPKPSTNAAERSSRSPTADLSLKTAVKNVRKLRDRPNDAG